MRYIVEAAREYPELEFPIVSDDVGVQGFQSEEVVHLSEVKKWWQGHQGIVKTWLEH